MNAIPTLGFLGPMGSHTSAAAEAFLASPFWQGQPVERVLCPSLLDTLLDLEQGRLAMGIIPVENALEGSVTEVMEGLHQTPIAVQAEFTRPIVHGLLVRPGTTRINTLVSHAQALAQCRQTLRRQFGSALQVLPAASTAQAAQQVANGQADAALGTHAIANTLGLEVRVAQMSDAPHNQTRFLALGCGALQQTDGLPVKSSIRVDFGDNGGDYPGALVDVLLVFKRANINLTKIESRPSKLGLGRYQFYIDVASDVTTAPNRALIDELNQYFCHHVHCLGPYYQLGLLP
jgi:prephenate dehydratase